MRPSKFLSNQGTSRAAIWYITTPRLKISVLWSYYCFLIISGLKYSGVPTVFDLRYLSLVTIILSLRSPSLKILSAVTNTLRGLMSLWMISCEWQWRRARQSYQATCQISFSEKYFLFDFWSFIRDCMSPSSAYSMEM